MFKPSPYQQAYFDWIVNDTGSCIVEAVAGGGKTTTIIEGTQFMRGSIFVGCYNKKIATELEQRAPKRAGLRVSTMHAAGFGAMRYNFGDAIKVDGNKCRTLYEAFLDANPGKGYEKLKGPVLKLVSLAKQAGIGALDNNMGQSRAWIELIEHFSIQAIDEETDIDNTMLLCKLARALLLKSIEQDKVVIDYDDMIYSPLFHDLKMYQNDWVLIDEAQDTNATRRALALKMLKRNGRFVGVGDERQAIYGFTGADSNALDLLAKATNARRLPLTVSYRCPRSVVAYAQQWVSHIQAHESAPEGSVTYGEPEKLIELARPGDAVLCRFNAPLVSHVYQFIAEGIPAKIEGREIGEGLKHLARRWRRVASYAALRDKLKTYQARETEKLLAKGKDNLVATIEDQVTCLSVIIDRCEKHDPMAKQIPQRVCDEIDTIFGEDVSDHCVVLSSIHKSKGREWHKVVWLVTGPSPYARKDWELVQETNLQYVAATRAKSNLVLVAI